MVIDVLPTAAFPHKTNLTAFFAAFGFCKILFLLVSVVAFYFFEQSHIWKYNSQKAELFTDKVI